MELNVHMFGRTNGNFQSRFDVVRIFCPHILSCPLPGQISHLVPDYQQWRQLLLLLLLWLLL